MFHRTRYGSQIVSTMIVLALVTLAACSSAPTEPPASADIQPTAAQSDVTPAVVSLPDCTSPASLTPALTEGPYFKAGSPERSSLLEAGMPGTQLTLTGSVLSPDCQPIAHALLDFWQADANGQYDNNGYTLRGHQYTDETGRYELITVVPGEYPGRTEHIHFKAQAPGGPMLTSQLFFPGVQDNQEDRIFDPSLLISITQVMSITQDNGSSILATYNFVIEP
jgi:protocatechuate 3,4-dioxygenase beta subunit